MPSRFIRCRQPAFLALPLASGIVLDYTHSPLPTFYQDTRNGNSESNALIFEVVKMQLASAEGDDEAAQNKTNGPCMELVHDEFGSLTGVQYGCDNFRVGNALTQYWNARAFAFFENLSFEVTTTREDLLRMFPKHETRSVKPSPLQKELYHLMAHSDQRDVCQQCVFPHGKIYAPWRLFGDTIYEDTLSVVRSLSATNPYSGWLAERPASAVIHVRCDHTVFGNEGYGFLPHRFYSELLPPDVTEVTLVGAFQQTGLCADAHRDLAQYLANVVNVSVFYQPMKTSDVTRLLEFDWLTMATAPVLICSPSTFCLSAAFGNSNVVYFPSNAKNLAVKATGPLIRNSSTVLYNFSWVETDYLPGPAMNGSNTTALLQYLQSPSCNTSIDECVPVNGSIPEKYRFH